MKHLNIAFLLVLLIMMSKTAYAQRFQTVPGYSESHAKSYLDENNGFLDLVEGIWQSSDGFKYAIEKNIEFGQIIRQNDKYRVIVLESGGYGWRPQQVKAFISPGSSDNIYSMRYYTRYPDGSEASIENVFLIVENSSLLKFTYNNYERVVSLYKLYPRASSASGNSNGTHPAGSKWSGTGFFLTKSGYVVTNQHVIDGARSVKVSSLGGNHNNFYKAEVVVSDKQNDLAIIKIKDSFPVPTSIPYTFKFASSNIGEDCWVLGYPLIQTMGEDIKLTNGIISSKSGFGGNIAQYQMSAPVQPGNSGGPVFDGKGNLGSPA